MKDILKRVRYKFVRLKMYAHRSMSYLAVINAAMLLFLTLSKLEDKFDENINVAAWFFPLTIGGVMLLVFFGWLDDHFGFFNEETRAIQKRNPDLQRILRIVEGIRDDKKTDKK